MRFSKSSRSLWCFSAISQKYLLSFAQILAFPFQNVILTARSQTASIQGHLQQAHTHWLTAIGWLHCKGHLFVCCLADFCCLLVPSEKGRRGKVSAVCVCVCAQLLRHYICLTATVKQKCRLPCLSRPHPFCNHTDLRAYLFVLFILCRVCSLSEQSLDDTCSYSSLPSQMHNNFTILCPAFVSMNKFTLKQI